MNNCKNTLVPTWYSQSRQKKRNRAWRQSDETAPRGLLQSRAFWKARNALMERSGTESP